MDHIIKDRKRLNFEEHFNHEEISSNQILFARHYLENLMGLDLDSDTTIEFISIRSTVFGYLIAHIAAEYSEFITVKSKDGFKTSSPGGI